MSLPIGVRLSYSEIQRENIVNVTAFESPRAQGNCHEKLGRVVAIQFRLYDLDLLLEVLYRLQYKMLILCI